MTAVWRRDDSAEDPDPDRDPIEPTDDDEPTAT